MLCCLFVVNTLSCYCFFYPSAVSSHIGICNSVISVLFLNQENDRKIRDSAFLGPNSMCMFSTGITGPVQALLHGILEYKILPFPYYATNFWFIFYFQAQHRVTKQCVAAKICILNNEDELEDFMVEIDILSECKHRNVVDLIEAYYYEDQLWVSYLICSHCSISLLSLQFSVSHFSSDLAFNCAVVFI